MAEIREGTASGARRAFDRRRSNWLKRVERSLETPMVALGFLWLGLLIWDLLYGLGAVASRLGTTIWIVFIIDFLLRWALACRKLAYLRRNWVTAIALVVPALRVLQVFRIGVLLRVARATNSIRLVRVLTSLNRGIRALGVAMGERGFGYVLVMTLLVTIAGAAAMYAFERNPAGEGINDYGTALWWTAMIMTTMGTEYWPVTVEGRVLCVLLALYAFAIFGFVTANIASFLVGRETRQQQAAPDAAMKQIAEQMRDLQDQVQRLREGR